jgi:CubicO group peptidase (beta-lactamase class C family)
MKKKLFFSLLMVFVFSFGYTQQQNLLKEDLSPLIENAYKTFEPAGLAVAVVKDGETALFAFGDRNSQTGEKVTTGSLFNIASCTKAFTSFAIAKLVEDGKIDWEDKVIEYIPEFQLRDSYISNNMNIVDILSHRSGLSTFTGDLLWYHTDYTDEEVVERMRYLPIEHDFREDFGYQNNMFMLAGEIIERVTDDSWSEYIKKNIFDPLEMSQTLPSNDEIDSETELAEPHLEGQPVSLYDFNATKPAASIHSNVKDMTNWVQMLLNFGQFKGKQIIDEEPLKQCFKPHNLLNSPVSKEKHNTHFRAYGLGWSMYDYKGRKIIEHNGGMPGYISKVTIVPEESLGFVVLNNGFEFFVHNALKEELLAKYLNVDNEKDWIGSYSKQKKKYLQRKEDQQKTRMENRKENTEPSLPLEKYSGEYKDEMYGKAKIKMQDGKPVLSLMPAEVVMTSKMKHWHFDIFRVDFDDPFLPFGLITFDFNAGGEVTGFKIDLPINDFHFQNLYFKKLNSN